MLKFTLAFKVKATLREFVNSMTWIDLKHKMAHDILSANDVVNDSLSFKVKLQSEIVYFSLPIVPVGDKSYHMY